MKHRLFVKLLQKGHQVLKPTMMPLCILFMAFATFLGCHNKQEGKPATKLTGEGQPTDEVVATNTSISPSAQPNLQQHHQPYSGSSDLENAFNSATSDIEDNTKANEFIKAKVAGGAKTTTATKQPQDRDNLLETIKPHLLLHGQSDSEPVVNMPLLERPGMADELISVNFEQADIRTVLKTIGDITGINFVVDENVHGTVTVMFTTKIRVGQLYEILESILEVQGYAAVPAGNLVKIVPKAEATKRNLQVRIGSDPSEIPKNDTVVTQIMPLRYADVDEVSQIIQPFLAEGSQMAVYQKTNSLVVIDNSSNIQHIAKIVQQLDVPSLKEQPTVFNLQYASAQVLSEQITDIIRKSQVTSTQSARLRSTSPTGTGFRIHPDVRTNSLIVFANIRDTETIERLIEQLDVPRPSGANNVHVIYLKNAQSKEVAESLNAVLASLRMTGALEAAQPIQVTADEGTNALVIAASPQDFEVVAEIAQKLDIVREQVLVEMLIVEVSEETLKELGIDWATIDEAVSDGYRGFAQTNFGPRADFITGDFDGLSVGAFRATASGVGIAAILNALERERDVDILSTPHIVTSNHQKASIIVGENIPFVTQSRITETTDLVTPTVIKTFEYKDVGITLEITPHISQGGLVRLEINSEFTKLLETVTSTSTDTPTTAKRKAETVVSMNSGSTIVIGGLIRDDKVTVETKVPLVGDVPLLGALFKHQTDNLQKTNLLIFITPYVLGNQQDLEQMTEMKKREMQSKSNKPMAKEND
jgi:general secretion pathway protein D